MKRKLGLIVNPVAGMGGSVGLKGSDGREILRRARELGAVPQAPRRSVQALKKLEEMWDKIELFTYPSEMGETEAKACGFRPEVIGSVRAEETSSEDTVNAAVKMRDLGVDLILFAGGDGTARNIYTAVGDKIPSLGIPAGVKIHSGVYATNPGNAGELAKRYLEGQTRQLREAEVMDIDEDAFREGRVTAKLYGYLKVPYEKRLVQSLKSGGVAGEKQVLEQIAFHVIDHMEDDCLYIIGPGTTTRPIMDSLGLPDTLLGVDVVLNKRLVAKDVNETQLLQLIQGRRSKIVVTVIGGQGYILGRGNQQISARVIKEAGKENIIIVATRDKLNSLSGSPLLVDLGDDEMNQILTGYYRVIVGYNDIIMHKVSD